MIVPVVAATHCSHGWGDHDVTTLVGFDPLSPYETRTVIHTAGCHFVRIFATPGWRNRSQMYSR